MSDLLVVDGPGGPGVPGSPGMLAPGPQGGYGELRRLPIFDGIPNELLRDAITSGGIERRRLERDVFVADPVGVRAGEARIVFVYEGQVAAGVFDSDDLTRRLVEQQERAAMSEDELQQVSALPPPPLARLAKKNVALFVEGDLFNSAALSASATQPIAFYTTAPTTMVAISHGAVADLAARFPFFEQRMKRAITASRQRLAYVTGVKQEMLDFFVRHGISVSGEMVRVRQLDRCIDCKQCEIACEERYGAKRLTLGGYQLGMLDFIYTCRTCTDQRCIDPCDYDSIKFDPEVGEVVINEATCTGCTLCAQACPYDAIEMVDVEDPANPTFREAFKLRLEIDDSLKSGPGAGRIARARRIANKCDHCSTYRDQACVSACPTGSLIEVSAYDLFRERSPAAVVMARAGYNQETKPDKKEVLPTHPFVRGIGVRDGGLAKVRRGQLGPVVLWALGIAAWLLALLEILLRTYSPANSLQYMQLMQDPDMQPAMALAKVSFHPGTDLAVWCGYVGTALMAISAIYPMFRRFRMFRFVASNTMWFDFHMMAGVVGPMFILLHSAMKLDNWVSIAFWCMIIVVVSGVIGRYLYTQVPDLMNGRELEELDHARAMKMLGDRHPFAAAEADKELAQHRATVEGLLDAGLIRVLIWMIAEDLTRPFRWLRRRRRIAKSSAPRKVVKELTKRTGRLMKIDRRRVLAPRAQLLLHSWKLVHVPFTILLVAISALHIWVAFQFSM